MDWKFHCDGEGGGVYFVCIIPSSVGCTSCSGVLKCCWRNNDQMWSVCCIRSWVSDSCTIRHPGHNVTCQTWTSWKHILPSESLKTDLCLGIGFFFSLLFSSLCLLPWVRATEFMNCGLLFQQADWDTLQLRSVSWGWQGEGTETLAVRNVPAPINTVPPKPSTKTCLRIRDVK